MRVKAGKTPATIAAGGRIAITVHAMVTTIGDMWCRNAVILAARTFRSASSISTRRRRSSRSIGVESPRTRRRRAGRSKCRNRSSCGSAVSSGTTTWEVGWSTTPTRCASTCITTTATIPASRTSTARRTTFSKPPKFVHAKEHQGNHNAIRDQAVKMDRLYHHIQDQVANWTPTGNRRVGNDDFFEKIASVEAIIHHLCWEVGVQPHHDEHHQPAQPIDPNQPAPPPAG